jgi:hypothetical protein
LHVHPGFGERNPRNIRGKCAKNSSQYSSQRRGLALRGSSFPRLFSGGLRKLKVLADWSSHKYCYKLCFIQFSRQSRRVCFNPKGQQTLHVFFPLAKGLCHENPFPPSLQVSGKINFNFGPSATLFLKKRSKCCINKLWMYESHACIQKVCLGQKILYK